MTSVNLATRVNVKVTGARGKIGLDVVPPMTPGEYLVWDAARRVRGATGTGADAGLRTDLADTDGYTLIGTDYGALDQALASLAGGPWTTPEAMGAVGDGVADDTAAWQAAAGLGVTIFCLHTARYLIKDTVELINGSRIKGNDATIVAKDGTGGFLSKDATQKNNNGATTVLFSATNRENISIENLKITQAGSGQYLIQPILIRGGFASSQLRISNIEFRGILTPTPLLAIASIGIGGWDVRNIVAHDCTITNGVTWFINGAQTTVFEIDNDKLSGVFSSPGYASNIRGYGMSYTGDALADFGDQTDVVNLLGGSGSIFYGIFGRGVAEIVDCFSDNNLFFGIRGEEVAHFVLKLIHGATGNQAFGVSGSGIYIAIINFTGSNDAGDGPTSGNLVTGVSGENFYANAANGVPCVVQFAAGGATQPENNVVLLAAVKGDANLDRIVQDGTADTDKGNVVMFADGRGREVASTEPDNVEVHPLRRTYAQIGLGAATQTIADATDTKVDFSSALSDKRGIATIASDGVTIVEPGVYAVTAGTRLNGTLADGKFFRIAIRKVTTVLAETSAQASAASQEIVPEVTAIVFVSEAEADGGGVLLSAWVRQDTGGTVVIGQASTTQFTIARVG